MSHTLFYIIIYNILFTKIYLLNKISHQLLKKLRNHKSNLVYKKRQIIIQITIIYSLPILV